ncbi:MAG: class I SAM-dependent methyltransferase [Candidatus Magasanikbacteria bacterium]|nr:class I SAM-dependent methyltransferase [Candidatus Magasanikbacteria bacterium]
MPFQENRYNEIAEKYSESDIKPDKKYSILPTVLQLAERLDGKTVLDLGCGDGFFTEQLASQGAVKVIGIDNSEKQIGLANKIKSEKTEYRLADIFKDELPKADFINSPFVLNYATDTLTLSNYFQRLFNTLNTDGKIVLVFDKPSGSNLEKFGAKKTLDENIDGANMQIDLYNQGKFILSLHATYFKEETIKQLLKEAGFQNITSHAPIISDEGKIKMGEDFWKGYIENSELGYITAEKI